MSANPAVGASYLLRGLRLLNQPGVRRFVYIPLLINLLLFAGLLWFAIAQFGGLIDWLMPALPEWLPEWAAGLLSGILWVLFGLSVGVLVFFTFTLVANLIGAPFNGFLAAAVERHLTGRDPQGPQRSVWMEVTLAVRGEFTKLGYFARRGLPLLVLFLVPGLNLAAPFLWLAFGAWMLALEYLDYPMGNDGLSFAEQRAAAGKQRLLMFGFGGAVSLGTMVPLINFIIMPAAVAGATALWVEQLRGPVQPR